VTLTNSSGTGGSTVTVTAVGTTSPGGSATTWNFSVPAATNHCTGTGTGGSTTLAPGASCTVVVMFQQATGQTLGVTHNGTVRFTDNATGSPQSAAVSGIAH
jgi:hypothetical protein